MNTIKTTTQPIDGRPTLSGVADRIRANTLTAFDRDLLAEMDAELSGGDQTAADFILMIDRSMTVQDTLPRPVK